MLRMMLTDRHREVLRLTAQGLRAREVANRLWLSESTVKQHLAEVRWRLHAPSTTRAVVIALMQGELSLADLAGTRRQRKDRDYLKGCSEGDDFPEHATNNGWDRPSLILSAMSRVELRVPDTTVQARSGTFSNRLSRGSGGERTVASSRKNWVGLVLTRRWVCTSAGGGHST